MSRPARKTNILDSELSIEPDQPKHAAQASTDRDLSPPVDSGFRNHCAETECVGPDQSVQTAQTALDQYITQRPSCWFSRGTANVMFLRST